jgi:hypothetical protein
VPVQVGVNAFGTAEAAADLAALGDAGCPDGLAASCRAGRTGASPTGRWRGPPGGRAVAPVPAGLIRPA